MDGQDAKVGLTLIYGRPHQHKIPVATVSVTAKGPATATQLTAFGVEPVAFSIVPVHASALEAPSVASVFNRLAATVERAGGDGPTFRIVVVNLSTRAVRGFAIEGTRAGMRSISGYRRAPRHAMLIPPGGAFALDVPASVIQGIGGTTRVAPDRVVISSVTWRTAPLKATSRRPRASTPLPPAPPANCREFWH